MTISHQVYGGGLIPIIAGLLLETYGIHQAHIYIGLIAMLYAILAIYAILATPGPGKSISKA